MISSSRPTNRGGLLSIDTLICMHIDACSSRPIKIAYRPLIRDVFTGFTPRLAVHRLRDLDEPSDPRATAYRSRPPGK